MKKPHIVIFNPDEMRADTLAHLGNPAAVTPNLDKLIKEDGVSFSNAYCQNTVCVPSRCSFFTGRYPHVMGHRTMSHMLHAGESSLLKELKENGWYVWMNRRNDFLPTESMDAIYEHCDVFFTGGRTPAPPGTVKDNPKGNMEDGSFYSFYQGELKTDENGKNYTFDDEALDEAIRLIKDPPKDKPLCIFLGMFYPHVPYKVEEPYFSMIDKARLPKRLPEPEDMGMHPKAMGILKEKNQLERLSESEWDDIRSCYLGMCAKIDAQFGALCTALKEAGIYDDTDIYFFSDHGDFTGDYGLVEKAQNLMPDCLTRVPLLIKPHKGVGVDAGITESMTELVDFYATAMDLAGITPDHTQFGRSLRPVLADRSVKNREYVFAEGGRTKTEREHCTEALSSSRQELFWPRFHAQLDDVAHTKATMIRSNAYKYVKRLYEQDEFYDLRADPGELVNQINNPAYQGEIAVLKAKMLDWYQETCDAVPYKKDAAFSPSLILENARTQFSPEKYWEFKDTFENNRGKINIIELCESFGLRIM